MELRIFTNNESLNNIYKDLVQTHNAKIDSGYEFLDAGFDILCPESKGCMSGLNKFDFQVKCAAYKKGVATGFYMYPRSSLSKTRLRLANSVGIIDSGYRGNLIGMFDCSSVDRNMASCECEYDQYVQQNDKLVQICAPNLKPFRVILVNSVEELSAPTSRGEGGFGSTSASL
jgi:dUTP pyrophosphatase